MSTTNNQADQTVYPRVEYPVEGQFWAEFMEEIIDRGIWDGFEAEVVDSSTVNISAGKMVLNDSNDRAVKVVTDSAFEQSPTESAPYGVARFEWVNEVGRFANFRIDSTFDNYDVVIYTAEFDGSGNLTGVNYDDRTIPRIIDLEQRVSDLESQ